MTGYSKNRYPQTSFLIIISILIFRQLLPSLSYSTQCYPISLGHIFNIYPKETLTNFSGLVAEPGSFAPGNGLHCLISQFRSLLLSDVFSSSGGSIDDAQEKGKSAAVSTNEPPENYIDSANGWKHVGSLFFAQIRYKVTENFIKLLPQPHAGLVVAATLGDKQLLSSQISPLLETTGTQHLLATSGLHLSLLIGLVGQLLVFVRGKRKSLVLWLLASCYLLTVGLKVSLIRAWVMMTVGLIAKTLVYRQYNSIYTLFFLAAVLISLDVSILGNVSFQLSYGATLSIILFANHLGRMIKFAHADRLLTDVSSSNQLASQVISGWSTLQSLLIVGIAAQLATVPLVIWHFGKAPLLGFIPSALLGLVMPLLLGAEIVIGMLISSVAGISGVGLEQAFWLQLASWLPVQLFQFLLKSFGQFDWILVEMEQLPWIWMFLWFVGLFLLYKLLSRDSGQRFFSGQKCNYLRSNHLC